MSNCPTEYIAAGSSLGLSDKISISLIGHRDVLICLTGLIQDSESS